MPNHMAVSIGTATLVALGYGCERAPLLTDGGGGQSSGTLIVSDLNPAHQEYLLTGDGLDSLSLHATGTSRIDVPPRANTRWVCSAPRKVARSRPKLRFRWMSRQRASFRWRHQLPGRSNHHPDDRPGPRPEWLPRPGERYRQGSDWLERHPVDSTRPRNQCMSGNYGGRAKPKSGSVDARHCSA